MMTNTPPNGAFRGFGAPQTQFAVEVHMDRIAAALGLDPVRLREIERACGPATRRPPASVWAPTAARCEVLREAVKRTELRRSAGRRWPAPAAGIGLSLFFHGSGFTGGGEVKLASKASLALTERGARILVGEHRDRPGHADDARADRRRHARHAVRRDRGQRRRHGRGARQRTDGRVAHVHDRRPDPAAVRRGDARAARRAHAARLPGARTVRSSSRRSTRSRRRSSWDETTLSRRRVRQLRLGAATSSRSRSIATRGRCGPSSSRRVHEIGKAIHPMLAIGQIEGGTRAGARLRAARGRRDARRPHGEQLAHQLHHPDDARHAADGRRDARESVHSTDRSAPRASARCRSTVRRRRSSTRCGTRASMCARFRRRRRS